MNHSPAIGERFKTLVDPEHWRRMAPALHVGSPDFSADSTQPVVYEKEALAGLTLDLIREGYFQLPPQEWGIDMARVAEGVSAVVKAGFMPVFAFMFDELWFMYARLRQLLGTVLDEKYMMLPAFWAWHVDGTREVAGWQPHRDLGHRSLLPDRRPASLTVWVPISDATPRNGCMYILPADRDPNYGTPRDTEFNIDLQSVRALPSPAGGVLAWTQAVLHWGARAANRIEAPRISMAMEFQRGDHLAIYEPLLHPQAAFDPEFRLRLILRQVLQYQHMYPLPTDLRGVAEAFAFKPGTSTAFVQGFKGNAPR